MKKMDYCKKGLTGTMTKKDNLLEQNLNDKALFLMKLSVYRM